MRNISRTPPSYWKESVDDDAVGFEGDTYLLFQCVEVVDDDPDEEIECEE